MADGGRTDRERELPEEDGGEPARRESGRAERGSTRGKNGRARQKSGRAPAGTTQSEKPASSGPPIVSLESAEVISISADASGNEATLPIDPR